MLKHHFRLVTFSAYAVFLIGTIPADTLAQTPKGSWTVEPPNHRPLKHSANPNYFQDSTGKAVLLCGSHTWNSLQDWGTDGKVQELDFGNFVSFLQSHGHNFTLLWTTELPTSHSDFAAGFHRKSAALGQDGSWDRNRRRHEIRSDEIQRALF